MTEEQVEPGRLNDGQRTRVEFARDDLRTARDADLADLPNDRLILLVVRLLDRLDDSLQIIDELTEP
jgi:hypothetical protein